MSNRPTKKLTLVVAVAIGSGSAAYAGYKVTDPVSVGAHYAAGNVGAARNSADGVQYIGCMIYGIANNTNPGFLLCNARNADGQSLSCSQSANEGMAKAVSAIGPTTRIYFTISSVPGADTSKCTSIYATNSSMYEPMQP